jgi:hypothetical protein
MKKILLLILSTLCLSCTNYYYVTTVSETPLYIKQDEGSEVLVVVPANEPIYVDGKTTKSYRKIKYSNYIGWAWNPLYTGSTDRNSYTSSSSSSSNSSSSSSSKTVHVKGYTRKDGTYVRPHTRSAPKKRS